MYEKNHTKNALFSINRNKIFDWINKEGMSVTDALERGIK